MSTSNKAASPGPRSRDLARRLRRVESRNITYLSPDFPVFWESAQGSQVVDVDGREYLDLSAAFAVMSLGHRPPRIQKSLITQSGKLWHGMGDVHPSAVKVALLEKLAALAPGRLSMSILSSTGSEAVESALKTARLATGKSGVIVFEGAYHGLSYGTLPATDRPEFSNPFNYPRSRPMVRRPYPDSLRGPTEDACLKNVDAFLRGPGGRTIGTILVEPIQGRGGIRIPKANFLRGLRQTATRLGILLIADEIMTGLGRTGRRWGVDHAGVTPDLLCVGKALANGFPLSACVGTPGAMKAWPASDGEAIHTSTFLGNPLGCAMALSALEELEEKQLAARAALLGEEWKAELQDACGRHPQVGEVRGLGLMLGIELVKDRRSLTPNPEAAARIVKDCLREGVLVLSGGKYRNVLTLTPPLTIQRTELRAATRVLKKVLYGTA